MEQLSDAARKPRIAVLGAGAIGRAFAVLFAGHGFPVRLYEPDGAVHGAALRAIAQTLADLDAHGLLERRRSEASALVEITGNLAAAVEEAGYVQECAPERQELKRELFAQLDALAPADAILASSSSAMPASRFADGLAASPRCLVAHPGNPPFLLRVIELVPAPFTAAQTLERAQALLTAAGMAPVLVRKEVEGFVFNRLQGAVLREAYCLVRDDVASVDDIDRIMREGLGLRWSVVGPFETVDLNTAGGIAAHARKLGPAYARMGAERGQDDPWTEALVAEVERQRRALVPADRLAERAAWRDREIMKRVRLAADRSRPTASPETVRPYSWRVT